MSRPLASVALIGSYPPRQCGIATFSADLVAAIQENEPEIDCSVVAMNDRRVGYDYPDEVKFQISQDDLNEYRLAADFLNLRNPAVISLQHEYEIFGGQRGSFIVELVKNLKSPLFTTFHTVAREPSPDERKIFVQLSEFSTGLVVMSEHSADFLTRIYKVPERKISLIPHGVPEVPFIDPDPCKNKLGVGDKTVILTFGLLSPVKGIEYMIDALPDIVSAHPEVIYYVVGATHPRCKAESGEQYRLGLHHRAKKLGVGDNIVFHDRFVDRDELLEIIRAADIYVTPYVSEAQVVSGALSFAVGAGKAVVSTPYWHAKELLADGRGRFVPFMDSQALSQQINQLLAFPKERLEMRRACYHHSRPMVMKEMGRRYLELFAEPKVKHARERDLPIMDTLNQGEERLPNVDLSHLRRLTDDTGILQHARFTVPNRAHGYCVDDNARALMVIVRAQDLDRTDKSLAELSSVYLSFLDDAFDADSKRFRNLMSYDRRWLESVGPEDAHGRAVWALGVAAAWGQNPGQVALAERLFYDALPALDGFSDSRAMSYPILGLQAYLGRNEGDDSLRELMRSLGQRLLLRFRNHASDDWRWHGAELACDNGRLPEALMACGRTVKDDELIETGLSVLEWLRDIQIDPAGGWFSPVGNQGWYAKSGRKAKFDQQPLEAAAMIGACIEAYQCTQNEEWTQLALTCFNWFLGTNDLQLSLFDHASGGCRDGLMSDGVNQNQGAEATLSYLSSLIALFNLRGLTVKRDSMTDPRFHERRSQTTDAA